MGGCVPDDVVKYYHGIQVTFTNGVLKFNSNANLDSVLSKLESDYETWNENYENQYPGLTADQLDSVDEITGFDEFKPVRDFENMFGDFYSKRSELEYEENNWLNNSDISNDNDPDSADYALDDFVDAISDINYQFKIGSDTYTFINDGLLKNGLSIEGGGGLMPQFATPCKAFKHTTGKVDFDNGSRRVFGRVAIHGGWPWGGVVKAVTKSYKKKGNRWKRARAHITAQVLGSAYRYADCGINWVVGAEKIKNRRKRVTAKYYNAGTIFKTQTGKISSSHECNGQALTLTLNFN